MKLNSLIVSLLLCPCLQGTIIGQNSQELNAVEKEKMNLPPLPEQSLHLRNVTSGTTDYTKGTFFLNEDWFGHAMSSINFLSDDGVWGYRAFQKENQGHTLGVTSQFGTIYGDKLYIVSKQAGGETEGSKGSRLAVCDAKTLKVLKEIKVLGGSDGRAFVGVNEHKGYVSTSNGVYVFDIDKLELKGRIEGTENSTGSLYSSQVGTMIRTQKYVFAVHQDKNKGILVIDPETDTVVKNIKNRDGYGWGSIVMSKDGDLWASAVNAKQLTRIDPVNLTTPNTYFLSTPIHTSWDAWTADAFCASTTENKLYWAEGGKVYPSVVYCFDVDTKKTTKFIDFADLPTKDKWTLYHAGFRIDPVTNELYGMMFSGTTTDTRYEVMALDASTAELKQEYPMEAYYWFPALPIFPDNESPVFANDLPMEMVFDYNNPRQGFRMDGLATDADNMDAGIVYSAEFTDADLFDVSFTKDSLILIPKKTAENDEPILVNLTLKANSNGKIATKEIKVTLKDIRVPFEINPTETTLYPGRTIQLVHNALEGEMVSWKSSDEAIVTVDKDGLVTAHKPGKATVTATNESREKENTGICLVTVQEYIKPTAVSLGKDSILISKDDSYDFTLHITPEDASKDEWIWKSSDDKILTVENGKVTAKKEGIAKVYVSLAAHSAVRDSCVFDVRIKLTKFGFKKTLLGLDGALARNWKQYQMFYYNEMDCAPATPSLSNITWEVLDSLNASFNRKEAFVDFKDKESEAWVVVRATTLSGDGTIFASDTCRIYRSFWADEVDVEPACFMQVQETYQLKPVVTWGDAESMKDSKKITYTSSNPEIVEVDEKGVLKAIAKGDATITAAILNDGSNVSDTSHVCVGGVAGTNLVLSYEERLCPDTIIGKIDSVVILTAKVKPDDATYGKARWYWTRSRKEEEITNSASNNSIAFKKIDDNQIQITFRKAQGASIWLKVRSDLGDLSDSICFIIDSIRVEKIAFHDPEYSYDINEKTSVLDKIYLSKCVSVTPANSSDPGIRFSSTNDSIVRISNNQLGTLRPQVVGTAYIYATSYENNTLKDSCVIRITDRESGISGITLEPKEKSVMAGTTFSIEALLTKDETKDVDTTIIWKSSRPDIASVNDKGQISALSSGEALICAVTKVGNFADTCKVTVVSAPDYNKVTNVSLNVSSLSLNKGEVAVLAAIVTPSGAVNKAVYWSSSDATVASVASDGTVTAGIAGVATITATTDEGGYTATCEVTVTDPDLDKPQVESSDSTATLTFPKIPEATFYEVSVYKYVDEVPVLFSIYTMDADGNIVTGLKSNLRSGSPDKIAISLRELDRNSEYIVKILAIKEKEGVKEVLGTFYSDPFTTSGTVGNERIGTGETSIYYTSGMLHLDNLAGFHCYIISLNGSVLNVFEIANCSESHLMKYSRGAYVILAVKNNQRISKKIIIK